MEFAASLMKWTCHLKATVLLPSACCLFLALRVSANAAERAVVPPPVHSRQSLSLGSPERLRAQAVERGRSGDYQSAIEILAGLYERDPDDAGAFHDLLIILGWAERDQEALHLADRLAPETAPVEVFESLAKSSRNIGDFEQSVPWYERAIARSPTSGKPARAGTGVCGPGSAGTSLADTPCCTDRRRARLTDVAGQGLYLPQQR